MSTENYAPPKVWSFEKGEWRYLRQHQTGRPPGATHHKPLPRDRHPIHLYSQGTWNGIKVIVMLEDLLADGVAEAEYDAWLIDIFKGDQFGSGFVELNPNFERQEKASWPRNR